MKRIINTNTLKTIWQGTEYLVDGQSGIVEPPLALLDDYTPAAPLHDPDTQRLRRLPDRADLENSRWIVGEMEVIDLTESELASIARSSQRAALRQQWEALPAYIRGPYRDKFEAANRLLDEGDDESAIALIEYTEPMAGFTQDQIVVFNTAKQQMQQGIANLPNIV